MAAPTGPSTAAIDPEAVLREVLGDDDSKAVNPSTTLTVHRTSPHDIRDRQVIISLDGKRIGQLMFGQTLTCEITPGRHRLRAYNTLVWKTVEFTAVEGSHAEFTCINRPAPGMVYMIGVFGIAPLLVTLKPGPPRLVQP
jgi:hypothetical protein